MCAHPTAAIAATQIYKMACHLEVDEQSNHCCGSIEAMLSFFPEAPKERPRLQLAAASSSGGAKPVDMANPTGGARKKTGFWKGWDSLLAREAPPRKAVTSTDKHLLDVTPERLHMLLGEPGIKCFFVFLLTQDILVVYSLPKAYNGVRLSVC